MIRTYSTFTALSFGLGTYSSQLQKMQREDIAYAPRKAEGSQDFGRGTYVCHYFNWFLSLFYYLLPFYRQFEVDTSSLLFHINFIFWHHFSFSLFLFFIFHFPFSLIFPNFLHLLFSFPFSSSSVSVTFSLLPFHLLSSYLFSTFSLPLYFI